jgi:methionine synthase II (cobalamin-independent)
VLDPYYQRDHARLVMDMNEALVCEVRELATAGAAVIQLDEPALMRDHEPGAWRLFKSCVRRLNMARGNAKLLVNPGWGDPAPILEELFSVPADILAIDLTRNPRLWAILAHAELRKPVQLGIVDGWSGTVEDAVEVAARLDEFVSSSPVPECYLSAATGFWGLTTQAAEGKLRVLSQVRDKLQLAGN